MTSMKDQIAAAQANAPAAPFRKPPDRVGYPRRMSLDLTQAMSDWLDEARYDYRVPNKATLVRGALALLIEDPKLAERAAAKGIEHANDET